MQIANVLSVMANARGKPFGCVRTDTIAVPFDKKPMTMWTVPTRVYFLIFFVIIHSFNVRCDRVFSAADGPGAKSRSLWTVAARVMGKREELTAAAEVGERDDQRTPPVTVLSPNHGRGGRYGKRISTADY